MESHLLAVCAEHIDTMREIAGESQPSLVFVCDMYQQRCDDLKRKSEHTGSVLEYFDRYL